VEAFIDFLVAADSGEQGLLPEKAILKFIPSIQPFK
jgi:hypothetical protein